MGIGRLLAAIFCVATLGGCTDPFKKSEADPICFSIVPANSNQPHSAMLLDACTGKSWLLVRTALGQAAEDGFTYKWMALDRIDWPPTLVKDQ